MTDEQNYFFQWLHKNATRHKLLFATFNNEYLWLHLSRQFNITKDVSYFCHFQYFPGSDFQSFCASKKPPQFTHKRIYVIIYHKNTFKVSAVQTAI